MTLDKMLENGALKSGKMRKKVMTTLEKATVMLERVHVTLNTKVSVGKATVTQKTTLVKRQRIRNQVEKVRVGLWY